MRKIFFIALILICGWIAVAEGGNTYAITSNKIFGSGVTVGADSVLYNHENWWKSNIHYSVFMVDTFTIFDTGVTAVDSIVDLGDYYSNVLVSSLNSAAESAYALVAPLQTKHVKGIWHNDTIARNFSALRVGCNSTDTAAFFPMAIRYLWVRKVPAGNDSDDVCLRIQGMR